MSACQLSIIIITLNEERRLPRLLDDLAAQSWQGFEVIHVDSDSDDATIAVSQQHAAQFPEYQVIRMPPRGVSLGRNTGAAVATGQRLLFLDADTRLPPDFLRSAMRDLDTTAADVGIALMSAEGLPLLYRLGFGAFNLGIRLTKPIFPTAIGACLFSTPDVHRSICGFDETIELCEDCDYVLRASHTPDANLLILKPKFCFDPRRLEQDGFFATGLIYLKANLLRALRGELRNQEITYRFGHYH